MQRKIFSTAVLLLAAACFLSACGFMGKAGAARKRTLTFWHWDAGHQEFYETLAKNYAGEHEGLNIEICVVPYETYTEEWLREAKAGRTADVFAIPPEELDRFMESGRLAYLSYKDIFPGDEKPELLVNSLMKEKAKAVHAAGSMPLIFYNKDIYEQNRLEVPETLSDFVVNCKILEQASVTPLGMSLSEEGLLEAFDLADGLLANGIPLEDTGKTEQDFSKRLKENTGYDKLLGLAMEVSVDKELCADGSQELMRSFAQERYAMIPGTTEDLPFLKECMSSRFDWFVLPDEDYTKAGLWKPELMFGAAKKGKVLKDAKGFLSYMMSAQSQQQLAEDLGKIPMVRGLEPREEDIKRAYDWLSGRTQVYLSCFRTLPQEEKMLCKERLDLVLSGKVTEPEEFLNEWFAGLEEQQGKK